MVTWQSTQLSLPWTDLAKTSGRTPIHSGVCPFLRGLNSASWQSKHSLFGTGGAGLASAAVGVSAENARPARRKYNPADFSAVGVLNGDGSLMTFPKYTARYAHGTTQALPVRERGLP